MVEDITIIMYNANKDTNFMLKNRKYRNMRIYSVVFVNLHYLS